MPTEGRHDSLRRQLRLFADSVSPDFDLKDTVLARLGEVANTAQFVSFSPQCEQRHSLVRGYKRDHRFKSMEEATNAILDASPEGRVNVRSFSPRGTKSQSFTYGLEDLNSVIAKITSLSAKGMFTIVNETVNIHDGGVSGVVHGNVLEFAPDATPRCVEEPGIATADRATGIALLETVYPFQLSFTFDADLRVEFSIHPMRRGYLNAHTILWEIEKLPTPADGRRVPLWPNRFSRFCGDKAFGLLVAHHAGFAVPATTVISRRIAPFRFGRSTGTGENWIRTCPNEPVPGKFTTRRGWLDPFHLLQSEDPTGQEIASVLCQDGVDALFSGAAIRQKNAELLVEGVAGYGDQFMLGNAPPGELPSEVMSIVGDTLAPKLESVDAMKVEWAFDGEMVWVLQLHRHGSADTGWMIYPGETSVFHRFDVSQGLEALRSMVGALSGTNEGIILVGHVGRTSHMCDLLRQARIPSVQEDVRC